MCYNILYWGYKFMRVSKEKWQLLCDNCMELLSIKTKSKKFLEYKSSLFVLLKRYYLGDTSEDLYIQIKAFNFFFKEEINSKKKKEKITSESSPNTINITFY